MRAHRFSSAVPAGLVAIVLAALAVPGLATGALFLAPALLLLAALLRGHYVGESAICRLAAARRARHRRPLRTATRYIAAARRSAVLAVPRGGRLVASSLAVRPPPAAALPAA